MRALRPPPYALDPASLDADTRVDVFTAGGPGGQHRNKTQNAVRLLHAASGVVVTATERRSLPANRKAAFERLRLRLAALNHVPRKRTPTRPSKGAVTRRLAEKDRVARVKADRKPPRDE